MDLFKGKSTGKSWFLATTLGGAADFPHKTSGFKTEKSHRGCTKNWRFTQKTWSFWSNFHGVWFGIGPVLKVRNMDSASFPLLISSNIDTILQYTDTGTWNIFPKKSNINPSYRARYLMWTGRNWFICRLGGLPSTHANFHQPTNGESSHYQSMRL